MNTWSDKVIAEYAAVNGSMEVHRSWRDTMLSQDRSPNPDRLLYSNLSKEDQDLDSTIAFDVVKDFLVWYFSTKAKRKKSGTD